MFSGMTANTAYFQKAVAVENQRLWMLSSCLNFTFLAIVVCAMVFFPTYMKPVEPGFRLQLWGEAAGNNCNFGADCLQDSELVQLEDSNTLFFTTSVEQETEYTMSGIIEAWSGTSSPVLQRLRTMASGTPAEQFAEVVKTLENASMLPPDVTLSQWNTTTGSTTIPASRIATMRSQAMKYLTANDSSLCPWGMGNGRCKGSSPVNVPDSSQFAAKFELKTQSETRKLPSNAMKTIVKSSSGKTIKTVKNGVVTVTVAEALDAAGMSGAKDDADISFRMEVSNTHAEGGGASVCEITISGTRAAMGWGDVAALDVFGSSRSRVYRGIRFKFFTTGGYSFFQLDQFIYLLTITISWLAIPGMLFFSFTTNSLGTLSEVISGFVYEKIDMAAEVSGVSARSLAYSYAQEDLSDIQQEEALCISHEQTKLRMLQLLEGHKTLGAPEKNLLTQFYFDNTAVESPETGEELIGFTEQLAAVTNNETLRGFADVLAAVDPDGSNKNALEFVFTDKTISALQTPRSFTLTKRTDNVVPHDTKVQLMNRLNLQSSLWVIQRCNLDRCKLGQVALKQKIDRLSAAGDKLKELAGGLQF